MTFGGYDSRDLTGFFLDSLISSARILGSSISIELLECKTDKCDYKLCDECKDLYYIKYKNKNCPNCRKKIENIDHFIEHMEEQKENTNDTFENYYLPTHGACKLTVIYCRNCIIVTGVMCFIGSSSFFLGSLIINPKNSEDDFDDYDDNMDKLSKNDLYTLQIIFGFIIFFFIVNVLRCCYKKCFQE